MKDLTHSEHKFASDLALLGTAKTVIADKIGCSSKTIYNSLHKTFPDEDAGQTKTRKIRSGFYKAKGQTLQEIEKYVLGHRWATNLEIIKECHLSTTSKWTVSRWLKQLGIGSYVACRRQGITSVNVNKR